jgi:hypothetical protein
MPNKPVHIECGLSRVSNTCSSCFLARAVASYLLTQRRVKETEHTRTPKDCEMSFDSYSDSNPRIPNLGIPDFFLNPEILGLDGSNPGISGLTISYISMQ